MHLSRYAYLAGELLVAIELVSFGKIRRQSSTVSQNGESVPFGPDAAYHKSSGWVPIERVILRRNVCAKVFVARCVALEMLSVVNQALSTRPADVDVGDGDESTNLVSK
jgi:hypothetical protein